MTQLPVGLIFLNGRSASFHFCAPFIVSIPSSFQTGREGATVIVTARHEPGEPGLYHHFIPADLSKAVDVTTVANAISQQYGGVDILIDNMVGISHWNPAYKLGIDKKLDAEMPLSRPSLSWFICHICSLLRM